MLQIHSRKSPAQRLRYVRAAAITASFAALLFAAITPARAQFLISVDYGNSITSDPNSAAIISTINSAIAVYQTKISTPMTARIAVGEMSTGLGTNTSWVGLMSYSSFLSALNAKSFSPDDATSLAILNSQGSLVNPVNGNSNIDVKVANLKALGFNANGPTGQSFDGLTNGQWDGVIKLNTHLMTPGSSGSSLQYSLLSVFEHEFDEVLGLGSGLPNSLNGTIFPEDLYRYSSSGARTYTTAGDNAYFSINGTTNLVQFNQNSGGDYGDWHTGGTPQVQDAFGTVGAFPTLGTNELKALDVIGYNLKTTAATTPEPGSLALLAGLGISGSCFALRRRFCK